MTIEEVISSEMERLIKELKESHERLGMKATGAWIDSLRYEINGTSSSISAKGYTEQLVQGREGGKRPPIDPLEKWVNAKFGIQGKEARSIAFAVANKIAASGTTWYEKGGSDLLEKVFTKENLDRVTTRVGFVVKQTVTESLIRQLQTA